MGAQQQAATFNMPCWASCQRPTWAVPTAGLYGRQGQLLGMRGQPCIAVANRFFVARHCQPSITFSGTRCLGLIDSR